MGWEGEQLQWRCVKLGVEATMLRTSQAQDMACRVGPSQEIHLCGAPGTGMGVLGPSMWDLFKQTQPRDGVEESGVVGREDSPLYEGCVCKFSP